MRNPIRKTTKAKWTEEDLQKAKDARASGRSIREVAREFNIPVTTLYDRLKSGNAEGPKMGRKPVFSKEQEEEMANHVILMAKAFYGVSAKALRRIAFEFAEKNNIPHNFSREKQEAGEDWLHGFLQRNPLISVRTPEATSLNRITGFNKSAVDRFFSNLSNLMDAHNFPPSRIFNMDESGLTCVQKPGKILAPKGQKQVGAVTSAERGRTVTICCSMNASGTFVPPMIIYPGSRIQAECRRGGPDGTVYACSKSGWITEELFCTWLAHFATFVSATKSKPCLLILDNHSSHISLASYNFCKENGIYLLSLPPHCSHRLQPLDLTFYGPLKTAYNKECDIHLRSHSKVLMSDVSTIFNKAYMRVTNMEKAISGFRSAGIHPLDPEVFTEDDFLGANVRSVPAYVQNDAANVEDSAEIAGIPQNNDGGSYVSVADISPMPEPATEKRQGGRRKQQSEHLTSTPMKKKLEEKERKRKLAAQKSSELVASKKVKLRATNIKKVKRSKTVTSKPSCSKNLVTIFSEDEDSDESENENIDLRGDSDEDVDIAPLEAESEDPSQEVCCVCGEFGRDKELWYKCSNKSCKYWTHKDCSSWENKLNPYLCDFCSK